MTCHRAVEALTKQQERLAEMLRLIDDGRWWSGDDACRIDENEVYLQADRIGAALDVIQRLATEMAVDNGTGTDPRLALNSSEDWPDPDVTPNVLGPFSPGSVGPVHDVIHESGGYERRAWGSSGDASRLDAEA